MRVRLRVALDCPLGFHPMMMHTKRGLSDVRTFDVAPLPTVDEQEGSNDTRDGAQVVPLDVTIDGRITSEDVDWCAVDVKAGQEVHFEVVGIRLGDVEFDPVLELFDADGQAIVRADDSALGRFDPCLRWVPEADGRVFARVRDVGYGGNSRCYYRLHIGDFPRPVGAVPCGGRPGQALHVHWVGDDGEEVVHLPDTPGDHDWYPRRGDRLAPTPIRLRVGDEPVLVEGDLPEQPVTAPFAWHGVVGAAGEEDSLRFAASKGERLTFAVHARDLRSPLDSVLYVRDAQGKQLAANDDSGQPDSRVRFTAPADGDYVLAIRDQLGRGGPTFFYRVETGGTREPMRTREAVPGRRPEELGVAIARGNRNATMIAVSDLDRGADVRLGFADLPPGVRCEVPPFVKGVDSVPVLFVADEHAPLAARAARPTATAGEDHEPRTIVHDHDVPLIRVRNNRVYTSVAVDALPVAVTEHAPFAIEVDAPTVPIIQGASLAIAFRIVRDESFGQDVIVRSLWAPPGIGAGAVRVKGDAKSGEVPLSARGNAMIGRFPMVLTAVSSIDGVARYVTSTLFELEVSEPWITAKVGNVRLEQGQSAELAFEVKGDRKFDGKLGLEFDRLPRGVTIDLPEIGFDGLGTRKLSLHVAPDAPPGRHRSHRLFVRVPSPHGPVLHVFDGGEIRIDTPLPASDGGGMR